MIETRLCTFEKLENGIIVQRYKGPCRVELDGAKETLAAIIKLGEGTPALVCAEITPVQGASCDARTFGASGEFSQAVKAIGLATQSKMARVVGSFFVMFNRPRYPSKFFDTEPEAQQWLTSLKI